MSSEEKQVNKDSLLTSIIEIVPAPKNVDKSRNFYDMLSAKADECFSRYNFKFYESEKGERKTLVIVNNICRVISEQELINRYVQFCSDASINITASTAEDWVRHWVAKQKEVIRDLPPSFTLNKNELSFCYIDIDLNSYEATPAWDSFISRCGKNGDAVMAFIWSIFENNCKSHQYLYIWGVGGDGKGSLLRWLEKLLGKQYQPLDASDRYWTAACVGKRVGVFADLNNTMIALTTKFKEITGRDKVMITQKYEKGYSASLDIKFILTSNRQIDLTNSNSDKRRAIVVHIEPRTNDFEKYEDCLHDERGSFLRKCRDAYNRLYKNNEIRCDYSHFEDAAGDFEAYCESIFNSYFEITLDHENDLITRNGFVTLLRESKISNIEIGKVKEWMLANGVKESRKKINTKDAKIYTGIKINFANQYISLSRCFNTIENEKRVLESLKKENGINKGNG